MVRVLLTASKAPKLAILAVETTLEEQVVFLLAVACLAAGADVAWVTDQLSIELPPAGRDPEIPELFRMPSPGRMAAPSPFLTRSLNSRLPRILIKPADRTKMEVMLDAPMICGNSHCGVCAS